MESFHKYTNVIAFLFLFFSSPLTLALQVGFYSKTCPNAETIVQQGVQQRFAADKSVAAALLRMHFHDCFVRVRKKTHFFLNCHDCYLNFRIFNTLCKLIYSKSFDYNTYGILKFIIFLCIKGHRVGDLIQL